jgi:hypothetical protein
MVDQLASRCPSVLVNETTEAIDPDDLGCIRFAPHLRRPNWRPLAEKVRHATPHRHVFSAQPNVMTRNLRLTGL